MVIGIVVIRKYRKAQAEGGDSDDDSEMGFAARSRASASSLVYRYDDPIDLGLDAGQPDPDLGQVARGGVYGGARQEPSGNVYGGAADPNRARLGGHPVRPVRSTAAVLPRAPHDPRGTSTAPPVRRVPSPRARSYGGAREEPQYGAFEGGGNGSVYDNAGPGESFGAPDPRHRPPRTLRERLRRGRPGPTRRPPRSSSNPGDRSAPGSPKAASYGAGNDERTPEAEGRLLGPA